MASHDTQLRNLRAISQSNNVRVKKLNEALRKLKERIDREHSNKNRVDGANAPKSNS